MRYHMFNEWTCVSPGPESLEGSLHGEQQEVNQGAEDVKLLVFRKEVAQALLRWRTSDLPRD